MDTLEAENEALRERVVELERKVQFLETHSLLAQGIRGEVLISDVVNGKITTYAAAHDVKTVSGTRLEVKRAGLSSPVKRTSTKRWQWAKIFGESGKKEFDFLILVGDADSRYQNLYRDPGSPYVIFCVPRTELFALTAPGQRKEYRAILLGSNPLVKKPESRILFEQYQTTVAKLSDRFGNLRVAVPAAD